MCLLCVFGSIRDTFIVYNLRRSLFSLQSRILRIERERERNNAGDATVTFFCVRCSSRRRLKEEEEEEDFFKREEYKGLRERESND